MAVNDGTGGVLQLPESNISDEEVHALAALLRNNTSIDELNLRGNKVSDDGARALGAVLAGRSGLRLIDLRGNKIGKGAIRILAEALQRSERVRHVYVHAGGKIEAIGASRWAQPRSSNNDDSNAGNGQQDPKMTVTVETICVIDVRDNTPDSSTSLDIEMMNSPNGANQSNGVRPGSSKAITHSNGSFNPTQLLDTSGMPPGRMQVPNTEPLNAIKRKSGGGREEKSIRRSATEGDLAAGLPSNDKQSKAKTIAQRAKLLKETSWSGRAGTLDVASGAEMDIKESLRLVKKKNILPPLADHEATDRSPSRGHSAPGRDMGIDNVPMFVPTAESEELVTKAILKARTGKNKNKKTSDTEKKLFTSPFAHPFDAKPVTNSQPQPASPPK